MLHCARSDEPPRRARQRNCCTRRSPSASPQAQYARPRGPADSHGPIAFWTATYFAFHEDVLARLVARQAAMRLALLGSHLRDARKGRPAASSAPSSRSGNVPARAEQLPSKGSFERLRLARGQIARRAIADEAGTNFGNAYRALAGIAAVDRKIREKDVGSIASLAGQQNPVVFDERSLRNILNVIEEILAGRVLLAENANLERALRIIPD